ncbi:MAG: prenyltransferase [Bacteroidales bacterium]|nr:prenyltransferase [Candidatus Cryptobacteroides choladohippi]
MKHTVKEWLVATRFWSFSVSAMPVIVTVTFLMWKGYDIRWLCAVLALVGNVMFHAAGNVLSDWWDYRKGVDNEKAYAIPQLVFGQFTPREYLTFSSILFAVAICIGLVLTCLTGWELLIIGGIGALLAANYSFFKFRALGDIFVFICFAILPVIGTSFVATGAVEWPALVISIPLGIFTIGVLHDNNTVDIETDKEAGIRTLPMLFGEKTSVKIFIAYMIIPFIAVIVSCILGYLPWLSLVCLIAAGAAAGNIKAALGYFSKGRESMMGLDQKTAGLHMIFSILLAISLLVASFI